MEKETKILLIEDVLEDIRYAEIQFEIMFGSKHTIDVCDYFSKAMQLLQKKSFDIIILDLSLPDSNGLNSLKKLSDSYSIPIIIYTGLTDELVKAEAMRNGAMDYLIKGKTSTDALKASIANSIIEHSTSNGK